MSNRTKVRDPRKRIAVLAPVGTLDHQPGILNAVTCFVDAGYQVDVLTVRNERYSASELKGAVVRYMPIKMHGNREPRLLVTALYTIWLIFVLKGNYCAVFSGGIRGLIAAWVISWIRPLRIINLQLELYIGSKLDVWYKQLFKGAERRAIRSSWLSLIHDKQRANMLAADAGIDSAKILILPNAPLGPSRHIESRFLQDRLGIDKDMKILLAPGTIHPNFMSLEIGEAAQGLPDDWLCVIHSAQPRSLSDSFIKKIIDANFRDRLRLSLEPVPYEEIDNVLAAGTIGLAMYSSAGGENTMEVGLASGKLCQFLKLGIPVIVSDYPMLRQFVESHGVGIAIRSLDELCAAIETIERDYKGYSDRAATAFDSELAFERHFANVLDRIENA